VIELFIYMARWISARLSWREENGQGQLDYVLLGSLLALACAASVSLAGHYAP
jgi:hypothetical protein